MSNTPPHSEVPATNEERQQQIQQDRSAVYGAYEVNMQALADAFTGALRIHYQNIDLPALPAFMAANFLVLVKAIRACHSSYLLDTYDDLHNYAKFSEAVHDRKPKE